MVAELGGLKGPLPEPINNDSVMREGDVVQMPMLDEHMPFSAMIGFLIDRLSD